MQDFIDRSEQDELATHISTQLVPHKGLSPSNEDSLDEIKVENINLTQNLIAHIEINMKARTDCEQFDMS